MPKPIIGPCGGQNQPPCPPQPADPVLAPAEEIVRAYSNLTLEERGEAYAKLAEEAKE